MEKSDSELRIGRLGHFELIKDSRKLTGYTLFISFFFREWKTLTEDERIDEIGLINDGSDYDSFGSYPCSIQHAYVIRYAAKRWKETSTRRKKLDDKRK